METYKFLIEGKVQRVGFRAFVSRYAKKNQIKGYVKNLNDGRVEVVANLDDRLFNALLNTLRDGSNYSNVESVHFEKINYKSFNKFEIKK